MTVRTKKKIFASKQRKDRHAILFDKLVLVMINC